MTTDDFPDASASIPVPEAPPEPAGFPDVLNPDGSLQVFAYGSLIWRPGFAVDSTRPALLRGYHRRFCLRSTHYRGTPERPGLVLGLDRGGACRGVVLRVEAPRAVSVLSYLDEREMLGGVYHRRLLRVWLPAEARETRALAYVADRSAADYCVGLDPSATAATIAASAGVMGANRDYLLQTVSHLRAMGVRDAGLERLASLLPAGT